MPSARLARLRLEGLEDRSNPAGTVTGSFAAGTWTLIGDAQANDITINPTATSGQFTVAGNLTTVAGVTNPSGVNRIVVKLGAGDDTVEINDTGTEGALAGNLAVFGGAGANSVDISDMRIGKNVTVLNGTNTTGADSFSLEDSRVFGKVTLQNGDGDTDTSFYRNSAGYNFVGFGVTIINGAGEDSSYINDTHVVGDIVVRNGLPDAANDAGYFEIYNSLNTTTRAIVRGHITVEYLAGSIDYDGIWDTEVTGNVTFRHGTGTAETYFDGYSVNLPVVIRGNLTIIDQGPSLVDIGTQYLHTGLVIGGTLTIQTGSGADLLRLHNLKVSAATTIATGGGIDTISVDSSTFRRFTLATQGGADVVNIDTQPDFGTQFLGDVVIGLGAGNDTLTLGAAGDATRRVEFLRPPSFYGGADNDTISLQNVDLLTGLPVIGAFETVLP